MRTLARATALLAAPLLLFGGTILRPGAAAAGTTVIRVLSNRADLISGDDALVEIVLPQGVDPGTLRADVDGRDVTSSFALRPNGRVEGLVTGLTLGPNLLTARLPDGSGAYITITNHLIGGPIFAGPQVHPWLCGTTAAGLAPPTDSQCNAPTIFRFFYKSSASGQFNAYDPANPPSDVATTTTDQGVTVPYVVRQEVGTADRGIYNISVLFDPAQPWSAWAPQKTWNHKVMWAFGGGSQTTYGQQPASGTMDDNALSLGYLVAQNSLNTHGHNANDNVSAEALVMLRERIIERYGEIRHAIGEGCSGGGLQQYMLADMYPGLIDGLLPTCSFPDIWTEMNEVHDCHILRNYFNNSPGGLTFTAAQRDAVFDHESESVCVNWDGTYASILQPNPSIGFSSCGLSSSQVYNPTTNPHGTRCTLQDYQVAIWGRRAADGFARRPLDNVGIQYGFNALNAGTITADQFIGLNAGVGGVDIDFKYQHDRTLADPGTSEIAYRTGQVTLGAPLANVPIIDLRGHDNEEFHNDYHSYEERARIDAATGGHPNHAIFLGPIQLYGDPAYICSEGMNNSLNGNSAYPPGYQLSSCTANPLVLMDRWLQAVEADASSLPLSAKIVRNKPAEAIDTCWISGVKVTNWSACQAAFPYFGTPREGAGEGAVNDVMKCQLKPLNPADYRVTFTPAQWTALQNAFPGGVCDWSQPAVGQQPIATWLTFMDGPGGRPMGPAPVSVPFGPAGGGDATGGSGSSGGAGGTTQAAGSAGSLPFSGAGPRAVVPFGAGAVVVATGLALLLVPRLMARRRKRRT